MIALLHYIINLPLYGVIIRDFDADKKVANKMDRKETATALNTPNVLILSPFQIFL